MPSDTGPTDDWIVSSKAAEFLNGLAKAEEKDIMNQIEILNQFDIIHVDDLMFLEDEDFEELGFTIGLKTRIRRYLAERKRRMPEAYATYGC